MFYVLLIIIISQQFLAIFTICTAIFDIYCLSLAAPGSVHFGYYWISYDFVYVGNKHGKSIAQKLFVPIFMIQLFFFFPYSVRNGLIIFALFSMLGGFVIFVTSIILIKALRKEYEKKMVPWLYSFAIFTIFRFFAFLYFGIVNDLYFGYNITISFLWILFTAASSYGWMIVYSLYIELSDLTKLEDLAHLRVSFCYS